MARALADTGTDFVQPTGAPPVGNGGPFVGPYKAAAGFNMSVATSPTTIVAASTGNTLTFTFTAQGNNGDGQVSITVPSGGWSAPQSGAGAGHVSVANGACSATLGTISGNVVNINFTSCSNMNTFTLTYSSVAAPTAAGSYQFTVSPISPPQPSVTVTAGAVNAAHSTGSASPTSVSADGSTTSTITVTLKDINDNPVSGKTVSLAAGSGSSTITTVSGTIDTIGQARFTVTDTVAQSVTYPARDTTEALTITPTATVTFTAGAVDAGTSTVSANPTSVVANGTSTSTITVTLKDINNNPVSGKTVSRSAEHTSELQSRLHLASRLLLEKKIAVKDTVIEAV